MRIFTLLPSFSEPKLPSVEGEQYAAVFNAFTEGAIGPQVVPFALEIAAKEVQVLTANSEDILVRELHHKQGVYLALPSPTGEQTVEYLAFREFQRIVAVKSARFHVFAFIGEGGQILNAFGVSTSADYDPHMEIFSLARINNSNSLATVTLAD